MIRCGSQTPRGRAAAGRTHRALGDLARQDAQRRLPLLRRAAARVLLELRRGHLAALHADLAARGEERRGDVVADDLEGEILWHEVRLDVVRALVVVATVLRARGAAGDIRRADAPRAGPRKCGREERELDRRHEHVRGRRVELLAVPHVRGAHLHGSECILASCGSVTMM
jgi:hypothetical protein